MRSGCLEQWKKIPGLPDHYEVSDSGRIRSIDWIDARGWKRKLKLLRPNKHGSVILRQDGKSLSLKLGRLILLAFVGPPVEGSDLCRHLDDDVSNMKLSNLAWGSYKDNYNDSVRNGKGGKGTIGAKLRGLALKGKKRSLEVKKKISKTKRLFPERQYFNNQRGKDGRYVGEEK